jgi:hypothetical protein
MKKFVSLSIILLFAVTAQAQEIFQKGTSVLHLGVGLGSNIPVEASFEYSIVDGLIKGENGAIGIGGYAGWYSHRTSYVGGRLVTNNFVLGARGAFHYQFVDKLDTYAGLMLGYNLASSQWNGTEKYQGATSAGDLSFSAFLGARYYLTPSIAAYSEVGYGISNLSIGVAFKL